MSNWHLCTNVSSQQSSLLCSFDKVSQLKSDTCDYSLRRTPWTRMITARCTEDLRGLEQPYGPDRREHGVTGLGNGGMLDVYLNEAFSRLCYNPDTQGDRQLSTPKDLHRGTLNFSDSLSTAASPKWQPI
ncbi:hypothetical protein J1614_000297 [Plenodomus biglobosus]|nr:hypothetical protein J1614_000297 [Plenodomus biglobosus]